MVDSIHNLLREIWDHKVFPNEWSLGIICTIHKKGDIWECSNYRGVTVLNTAYKVFSKILCIRIEPFADKIVGSYQAGFSKGKSTINQISAIKLILERTFEYGIDTPHICGFQSCI